MLGYDLLIAVNLLEIYTYTNTMTAPSTKGASRKEPSKVTVSKENSVFYAIVEARYKLPWLV